MVSPSSIQRQSGANGTKTQTGRPIAPARCASAVSTVMRRSHNASTAAVSLKSLPEEVAKGHAILLADGNIELRVERVDPPEAGDAETGDAEADTTEGEK